MQKNSRDVTIIQDSRVCGSMEFIFLYFEGQWFLNSIVQKQLNWPENYHENQSKFPEESNYYKEKI